jgi:hypothetical protein
MIVEKQMECRLAGEPEVLGENLPQRHFCHSQNPTWPDPGLNPGRRGGKPATNRLIYGAALLTYLLRYGPKFWKQLLGKMKLLMSVKDQPASRDHVKAIGTALRILPRREPQLL